jgi:hypothetical protein
MFSEKLKSLSIVLSKEDDTRMLGAEEESFGIS